MPTRRSDSKPFDRVIAFWSTMDLDAWLVWILLIGGMIFLLILPGCATPDTGEHERQAFNATERLLVHQASEMQAGRLSPADFLADMRKALDELQAAEQGVYCSSGTSWIEVLATALGSSAVVGGALHVLRNSTRKSQLEDLARNVGFRLSQVEAKGGAT